MDTSRRIVAVVVAVDSPAGRVVEAIDDLAAHLPGTDRPQDCPLCSWHPPPTSRPSSRVGPERRTDPWFAAGSAEG
ncbi:hypothetical protein GCM10022243_17500 [Saccharothrix violaceirubra]|uniref:Uncharacterized protein n=1 Tax=Saccharothrix violaceirubra TaxID=413306 RepID=A0A7W7SYV6_9PSEU|nr:hypothetical protein [Saccharothrix violaceirubra]MBB4963493.1 hypothetical protein [Saccharothrix violaceirubra]